MGDMTGVPAAQVTQLDESPADGLIGQAPPSPAGPLEADEAGGLSEPPAIAMPRLLQVLRFNQRQIQFVFRPSVSTARSFAWKV